MLWGAADFFGGSASRRLPALTVVLVSQAAGLTVAVTAASAAGSWGDPLGYLPWAIAAGLVGATGLVLFYQALAIGTMGVVSPIASLGVVVPVLIGLITGVLPSWLAIAGIVVAIVGVVAASGPEYRRGSAPAGHGRSLLLAVGSAAGFGLALYAISRGAHYSVVMTMTGMRAASVPVLALLAVVAARRTRSLTDREPFRSGQGSRRPLVLLILACGVFDVSANLLFGLATTGGALAVVAVLGSLYPAATVLLARFVHGERLTRIQRFGVGTALAGVAMIAAGS